MSLMTMYVCVRVSVCVAGKIKASPFFWLTLCSFICPLLCSRGALHFPINGNVCEISYTDISMMIDIDLGEENKNTQSKLHILIYVYHSRSGNISTDYATHNPPDPPQRATTTPWALNIMYIYVIGRVFYVSLEHFTKGTHKHTHTHAYIILHLHFKRRRRRR